MFFRFVASTAFPIFEFLNGTVIFQIETECPYEDASFPVGTDVF